MPESFEEKIRDAIANPKNMGEMRDADAVGTVGSPECGDMVRLWLKFTEKGGKKVIDRASFQSFGCQTAIAVASLATELLAGKTVEEARQLGASDLSEPLGPLPPMKIHCGQMVEGALREALRVEGEAQEEPISSPGHRAVEASAATLLDSLSTSGVPAGKKLRIVKLN
ncbi:MAG: nitrogen fixation protein NifU [Verrucomicrobia bacterium]|jgi:nitrogen fixation NifU-like protein|nr:MAG: nitrogen fixation protein NifU [Verrucomicrobiota bacterium]